MVGGHTAEAGRKGIANAGKTTSEVGEVGSPTQSLENGEDLFPTSHVDDAQLQAAVGWRVSARSRRLMIMCSLLPDFLSAVLVFP